MTPHHAATELREIADVIGNLPSHLRTRVTVDFHGVTNRKDMAAIVGIMHSPVAKNFEGAHWVIDESGDTTIHAFYSPGLLGDVVTCEINSDLSRLKEEA